MTSALERAARAVYAVELDRDENVNSLIIRVGGNQHPSTRIETFEESPVQWGEYASAAITAFLSPEDEEMRLVVGNAYREGMREFLENMRGDSIGAINAAMQDAGARAAIAALREMATAESVAPDTAPRQSQ